MQKISISLLFIYLLLWPELKIYVYAGSTSNSVFWIQNLN